MSRFRWLRYLLIAVASCTLFFSMYKIYDYFSSAEADKALTETLASAAVSERTDIAASDDTPVCPIEVDFEQLRKTNGDTVAWIYCEGTPINYPIAQSDDNSYYLHLRLDGTRSAAGTLFADFRCSNDFSELNSIVYGHNMKNGTMFGTLPKYKNQSYYDEHPAMWLVTPDKSYKIELIAGFVTESDSDSYDIFYDRSDLEMYIETAVSRSTFVSGADVGSVGRIIELSTCSYEYNDARYVVLGELIEAK